MMVREEFDTVLNRLKNGEPFRPFVVKKNNGESIEVNCADALAVRDGMAFYIKPCGASVWIEHECVAQVT